MWLRQKTTTGHWDDHEKTLCNKNEQQKREKKKERNMYHKTNTVMGDQIKVNAPEPPKQTNKHHHHELIRRKCIGCIPTYQILFIDPKGSVRNRWGRDCIVFFFLFCFLLFYSYYRHQAFLKGESDHPFFFYYIFTFRAVMRRAVLQTLGIGGCSAAEVVCT